jgi:G3E family GTPase
MPTDYVGYAEAFLCAIDPEVHRAFKRDPANVNALCLEAADRHRYRRAGLTPSHRQAKLRSHTTTLHRASSDERTARMQDKDRWQAFRRVLDDIMATDLTPAERAACVASLPEQVRERQVMREARARVEARSVSTWQAWLARVSEPRGRTALGQPLYRDSGRVISVR